MPGTWEEVLGWGEEKSRSLRDLAFRTQEIPTESSPLLQAKSLVIPAVFIEHHLHTNRKVTTDFTP